MALIINEASGEPIYLQIRSQVIASIADGSIAPGDQLASVRQLARDLGINLHTVNKAYAMLRDEGYIVMRSGRGAVVAVKQPDECDKDNDSWASRARVEESVRRLLQEHKAAGRSAASFLQIVREQTELVYGTHNVSSEPDISLR